MTSAARRLGEALLAPPAGMKMTYGPEVGRYGSLQATRRGQEAIRQARLDRSGCATAGQLDATAPEVSGSPAAVVAFASQAGSLTQALVALPKDKAELPGALARECRRYRATVGGQRVTYTTRELATPKLGDGSRTFLTTTSGGGQSIQIGTGVVRHGNVIMSILVVGSKVKSPELSRNIREAYEKLTRVIP